MHGDLGNVQQYEFNEFTIDINFTLSFLFQFFFLLVIVLLEYSQYVSAGAYFTVCSLLGGSPYAVDGNGVPLAAGDCDFTVLSSGNCLTCREVCRKTTVNCPGTNCNHGDANLYSDIYALFDCAAIIAAGGTSANNYNGGTTGGTCPGISNGNIQNS